MTRLIPTTRSRWCSCRLLLGSLGILASGPPPALGMDETAAAIEPQEPNAPNLAPEQDWPSPVADDERYSFFLADVLEYRPGAGGADFRADIEAWYGGDRNRVWIQGEGQRDTSLKADYDLEAQVLYGRFLARYYDVLVGGGVETQKFRGAAVTRGQATISIQGLVPYAYEVQPSVFVSHAGHVAGRLAISKDLLLTQRLILQPRLEVNAAIQRVVEFTTGRGLNNTEFGLRLRYEVWREFAPYVGLSFDRSFFETATLVRADGGDPRQVRFVAGLRVWL